MVLWVLNKSRKSEKYLKPKKRSTGKVRSKAGTKQIVSRGTRKNMYSFYKIQGLISS